MENINNNANDTTPTDSEDWVPYIHHQLFHYSPPPFTLSSPPPFPWEGYDSIADPTPDSTIPSDANALFDQFPFLPSQTPEAQSPALVSLSEDPLRQILNLTEWTRGVYEEQASPSPVPDLVLGNSLSCYTPPREPSEPLQSLRALVTQDIRSDTTHDRPLPPIFVDRTPDMSMHEQPPPPTTLGLFLPGSHAPDAHPMLEPSPPLVPLGSPGSHGELGTPTSTALSGSPSAGTLANPSVSPDGRCGRSLSSPSDSGRPAKRHRPDKPQDAFTVKFAADQKSRDVCQCDPRPKTQMKRHLDTVCPANEANWVYLTCPYCRERIKGRKDNLNRHIAETCTESPGGSGSRSKR